MVKKSQYFFLTHTFRTIFFSPLFGQFTMECRQTSKQVRQNKILCTFWSIFQEVHNYWWAKVGRNLHDSFFQRSKKRSIFLPQSCYMLICDFQHLFKFQYTQSIWWPLFFSPVKTKTFDLQNSTWNFSECEFQRAFAREKNWINIYAIFIDLIYSASKALSFIAWK